MQKVDLKYSEDIVELEESKYFYNILKRALDIILCLPAALIAIPIIAATCIAVELESKGNPIYVQERVGLNGKKFLLFKIRSMRLDAEKNGPQWANKNDNRVTKVGKFIRKTKIDELPQLFNIIIGHMSIVGPRPEREIFVNKFEAEIPGFVSRLKVKPGLTGLAQINGGYELTPKEKLILDLKYIEKRSIFLDIKIIVKTFSIVISGEGSR